jgi:hypothetical protein
MNTPARLSPVKWAVLGLVLALAAGITWREVILQRVGGPRYANHSADLAKLKGIVIECEPVLAAIKAHRSRVGRYPSDLNELRDPFPALTSNAIQFKDYPIYYQPNSGVHFDLYIKLNWDAGLRYHSDENSWAYDPGDGSEGFILTVP